MPCPDSKMSESLDCIYDKYNHREYVHPDPLEFLYRFERIEDREIVGLLASALAYGRVRQILVSISRVLDILGSEPSSFIADTENTRLTLLLAEFRHRFTAGSELAAMLSAASALQREHGLLGNIVADMSSSGQLMEGLSDFVSLLLGRAGIEKSTLLPRPCLGSACKRLHLYLRWMIRQDEVDPGGWDCLSPADLIVPLDVHMFRAGRSLGFTRRKSADGRAALEVTEGFRRICRDDPVKYDFAVTRYGILGLKTDELFRKLFST
jgi:uncharacterized protein (TIGR02757 family)